MVDAPPDYTDLIARLNRLVQDIDAADIMCDPRAVTVSEAVHAIEALTARNAELEAERSSAIQIIGLLVDREGGEVVITDREAVRAGSFDVAWFESIDPPARKIVAREHAYGVSTEGAAE